MKNEALELILKKEMGADYEAPGKKKKRKGAKVRGGKLARKEAFAGFLFVLPWIIGAIAFLAYPIGCSFWYALNNIRITPLGKTFKFLKFGNFTQILQSDADFPIQLMEYLVSTVISVPIIIVFALIIAMLLNGKIKFKGGFRLIFFLPVIVVSGPVMGMLAEQGAATISSVDTQAITSAINGILPGGIGEGVSEIFENMITILWYSGVQILIFLSALQKIDSCLYEAAKIDGGSAWECFWKITLPTIKPMILLNAIYTIVFISGNEQNGIIGLIQNAMFSGTKEKGYGYASAMAWLYSVVVIIIVVFFTVILTLRKDVYVRKYKRRIRALKKEQKMIRKVERRNARHAKRAKRTGIY